MAGKHLDAVVELEQPPERAEETVRALLGVDREVRPRRVTDEERVSCEHEPWRVGTRTVDDSETRVLRPVARSMDCAEDDLAELDLAAVLEWVVRIGGLCGRVNRDRDAELEREPPVAGEMIRVGVCLDHADDPDALSRSGVEYRLDRVRGVDDDRYPGIFVPHEVRRAPEVVVEKLLEEHGFDASSRFGFPS